MVDADRARQLMAAARRRPPPGTAEQLTAEELHDDLRATLARHAPPAPPDPLTGRVPTADTDLHAV